MGDGWTEKRSIAYIAAYGSFEDRVLSGKRHSRNQYLIADLDPCEDMVADETNVVCRSSSIGINHSVLSSKSFTLRNLLSMHVDPAELAERLRIILSIVSMFDYHH